MANIEQLVITGIRSFGADDEDKGVIVFKKPLTLILGENGCGKTTIIESLKYALCGELPPNSNKGQSFVHDPKVNKSREVLGQIRLKFVSPDGNRYAIIKSMQSLIKQKNMQFKSLDSTLQVIDDKGNCNEISGRCGQADATIASILGVSKAILNNVIFCHQDDSNWPLEEGKKLKERFDDIFDATKYNKCFESIRKTRKQYATDIKLLEMDVKFLSEGKKEYDEKKLRIIADEEKITDAKSKSETLQLKLNPIQSRLSEITEVENNILQIRSDRERAKIRMEDCKNQQANLKQTIKTLYVGSDEELQDEIETFTSNLHQKESQIEVAAKKLKLLKNQENETSQKISSLEIKKSELFTLEGQHQEKVESRNQQLIEAAQFAEIEISGDVNEENEAAKLWDRIERKKKAMAKELKEFRETCEEEEKNVQKNVDSCRDASARQKQKILCKKQECQALSKKVEELNRNISSVDQSKGKLDTIEKDLHEADRAFQKILEDCDITALQDSISDNEQTVMRLESELEELDKMIKIMQDQHAIQTEVNVQKEALSKKEKFAMRCKNKNRDVMIDIFGKYPETNNLKALFQKCQQDLRNEADRLNKELKLKQHEVTTLDSTRTHQKEELKKKKAELTTTEEQLYNFCGKLSLEDKLAKLDGDISLLQEQKIEVSSFEFVTRKFVEKLNGEKPCCPLCHRGFESQQEISDLLTEWEEKIRSVPKNLDSVLETLSRHSETRDKLVSMRPSDKRIQTLKNEEIPSIEKALDRTEKELQEAQDRVEDLQMSVSEPERKLEAVGSLLPDMSLLDQAMQDIANLSAEVAKLESKMSTNDSNMNLDEAVTKQGQTKTESNRLRAVIKSHQNKINDHNKKLQVARDKKNALKEESLKIQAKIQELCSLEAQLNSCQSDKEKGEIDLKSQIEISDLLQTELQSAETKKKNVAGNNKIQCDKRQIKVIKFEEICTVISQYNKGIADHKSKNIRDKLEELKEPLTRLMDKKEQLMSDIQTNSSLIDGIKDELSNQQVNKRDLEDNLTLRRHQKDQQKLINDIKKIDGKIGEMNYTELASEKITLLNTQSDIILKRAQIEGSIKELKEIITVAKAELLKSKYKDIHQQYKKKFCEMVLMKGADLDLKNYATSMDLCLMQFHKEKMSKINNIIRDMWRNIYRGNDIDYIEIKTDENTDSASGNKRVYNYRVVQRRNDTEIDMRGRCSAGQKVLACLIIRMALAETFSNRFGVLALDEPTTNLDRENVTSLCNALGDMVLARMKQNNFMFIIITHDAEFLTSLGRIDKLTHYYRVSRNQNGKSKISKERMT